MNPKPADSTSIADLRSTPPDLYDLRIPAGPFGIRLRNRVEMPTITFVKEKKTVEVPAGANLRKEALKAGVQLYPFPHNYVNCLGLGLCTSCRVNVKKGLENCSSQGIFEKVSMVSNPLTFFARLGNEKTLRLACQLQVNGDVEVETKPPMNWHGENYWS